MIKKTRRTSGGYLRAIFAKPSRRSVPRQRTRPGSSDAPSRDGPDESVTPSIVQDKSAEPTHPRRHDT